MSGLGFKGRFYIYGSYSLFVAHSLLVFSTSYISWLLSVLTSTAASPLMGLPPASRQHPAGIPPPCPLEPLESADTVMIILTLPEGTYYLSIQSSVGSQFAASAKSLLAWQNMQQMPAIVAISPLDDPQDGQQSISVALA